jgi:hypothetical protein
MLVGPFKQNGVRGRQQAWVSHRNQRQTYYISTEAGAANQDSLISDHLLIVRVSTVKILKDETRNTILSYLLV